MWVENLAALSNATVFWHKCLLKEKKQSRLNALTAEGPQYKLISRGGNWSILEPSSLWLSLLEESYNSWVWESKIDTAGVVF